MIALRGYGGGNGGVSSWGLTKLKTRWRFVESVTIIWSNIEFNEILSERISAANHVI